MTVDAAAEAAARTLSMRLFRGMLATQETLTAYLGVRLGLYELLHSRGALTVDELAAAAGLARRYAREWLEQQVVCGLLEVDDPDRPWPARAYRLVPGHHRVLTESADPLSLISTCVLPVGGIARALPHLLEAYRTGAGVAAAVFGDDWRKGHGGANRAIYTHQLTGWLRVHLPDVHGRLSAEPSRVADVGCGAGWAAIGLASAYPRAHITALDVDADVVELARAHVSEAHVATRVDCVVGDVSTMDSETGYDLVCLFDVAHELARPVEALRACRLACAPGGTVLVLDSQVPDAFGGPGDEIERFQYAASVLHCLPAALDGVGAEGSGTVLRSPTVREYATAAGFRDLQVIDLDDRFHRLYRLRD